MRFPQSPARSPKVENIRATDIFHGHIHSDANVRNARGKAILKGMDAEVKYKAARHANIVDVTTAAGLTYLPEVLNIAMVVRFTANIVKNLEMTQVILIFACWIGLPEWV